ncbi:MAG: hypothetical protein U0441_14855 [Polyangiaceae bacterium]
MSAKKKGGPGAEAAASIRDARARRKAESANAAVIRGELSFRAFVSSRDYFPGGLELSPAIAAIIDASDGRPDLIEPDLCRRLFNCDPSALPTKRPRVIGVAAGRRGGKTSRLLAPAALFLAWTCPLPNVRDGEVARVAVLATDIDAAGSCLSYVKGMIAGSPILRAAVIGDSPPDDAEDVGTASGVVLRRPDGKRVDIVVRAASRGGRSVRSRTLAGLVLDEAAFLFGEDGRTANDRSVFDAALPALEPGGQVWVASTPWIEGEGLLEQLITENWSTGTQGRTAVVAARVSTRLLRPEWDPDGSIEQGIRNQQDGDLTADREIHAIPLKAGSRAYFQGSDVEVAMGLLPPDLAPQQIGAGADYAHVSDRSALALVARYPGGIFGCSLVREVAPAPDIAPSTTYADFARTARAHGARAIASDGHYRKSVEEEYTRHGVSFELGGPTDRLFAAGRTLFRERRLALGALPEPDKALLRRQLAVVVTIPGPNGKSKVHVPRTTIKDAAQGKGTSHCDALVAMLTGLNEVGSDDPALWAHEEEKRAKEEQLASEPFTPPPGSLASLNAYRNKGVVSTGKFW